MERDFTDAKLNELLSHINNGSGELNRTILGITSTYSHWNGSLAIDVGLGLVGLYLKALFDRHEKASAKLKNIFADARSADSQYKTTFALYNEGLEIYKDFIEAMAETVDPSKTLLDITALKSKVQTLNSKKSNNLRKVANEIMAAFLSSSNVISTADRALLNEYADEIFQKQKDGKYLTQSEKDFLADYATAVIENKKLWIINPLDYEYLEKYLDYLLEGKVTGANIASLNADDRQRMITVFEALHPGDADNMDDLFEDMAADTSGYDYSEDINNIKYIIYTADEPYRSIFLEYADNIVIGDYDYQEKDSDGNLKSQHYSPSDNEVYIRFHSNNNNVGINDPQGPYVVFFHEYGHAIDDVAYKDGALFDENYMTQDYTSGGLIMQKAAEQDVYNNIKASVKAYAISNGFIISDATEARITDAIMAFDNSGFKDGSTNDKIYDEVIAIYKSTFGGTPKDATVYCGISDVYGGFTDNKLKGTWGHSNERDPLSTYWNDWQLFGGTEYTGKQSKELWAETFSRYMTGNEEAIKELNRYFPTAIPIMDEALESLKE